MAILIKIIMTVENKEDSPIISIEWFKTWFDRGGRNSSR